MFALSSGSRRRRPRGFHPDYLDGHRNWLWVVMVVLLVGGAAFLGVNQGWISLGSNRTAPGKTAPKEAPSTAPREETDSRSRPREAVSDKPPFEVRVREREEPKDDPRINPDRAPRDDPRIKPPEDPRAKPRGED